MTFHERNARIYAQWKAGQKLSLIAIDEDLTNERVRQIIAGEQGRHERLAAISGDPLILRRLCDLGQISVTAFRGLEARGIKTLPEALALDGAQLRLVSGLGVRGLAQLNELAVRYGLDPVKPVNRPVSRKMIATAIGVLARAGLGEDMLQQLETWAIQRGAAAE